MRLYVGVRVRSGSLEVGSMTVKEPQCQKMNNIINTPTNLALTLFLFSLRNTERIEV